MSLGRNQKGSEFKFSRFFNSIIPTRFLEIINKRREIDENILIVVLIESLIMNDKCILNKRIILLKILLQRIDTS